MNKDAGNGGTRLDAAKQAVSELVDRLPAGAPIGLRVYGSKMAETSREEACRDTELTIPVGPLDKEQLDAAPSTRSTARAGRRSATRCWRDAGRPRAPPRAAGA